MTTCERCDVCGRKASNLVGVQTLRATHSSPAEWANVCRRCHDKACERAEYEEEARSLRKLSDEQRERV